MDFPVKNYYTDYTINIAEYWNTPLSTALAGRGVRHMPATTELSNALLAFDDMLGEISRACEYLSTNTERKEPEIFVEPED